MEFKTIATNLDNLRMKRMCYKFSDKSTKRMKGVHPDLITIFTEAIKYSPIDFGIPQYGGIRTTKEQKGLFDRDLSNADGVKSKSRHQIKDDGYGHALDFYAYVNGKASWKETHMAMVASTLMSTAKRLKKEGRIKNTIYWGGQFGCTDFTGWDMPHIEIT